LLGLATGTRLHLGPDAVVKITRLRNPCDQLDRNQQGAVAACSTATRTGTRAEGGRDGSRRRGGDCAGDEIRVELPAPPHHALEPV
jgi:MOSC domain-containing protein YiiM